MYVTAVQPDTIDAPDLLVEQLACIVVAQGHCDHETIQRGQRVAAGSGQRLDAVLIQLGLVTERGLAQAYAELIGVPVAGPERYPAEPLFPGQLTAPGSCATCGRCRSRSMAASCRSPSSIR